MAARPILTQMALVGAVSLAYCTANIQSAFYTHYRIAEGSRIKKAACLICHSSLQGGKLNSYGQDIAKAMKAAKTKKPAASIFAATDKIDSNKNGASNGDEIRRDVYPGAVK